MTGHSFDKLPVDLFQYRSVNWPDTIKEGGYAGRIMETNVLLLYLVCELLLTNSLNNVQNKTIYFKMKICKSSWCKIKITIEYIMKNST